MKYECCVKFAPAYDTRVLTGPVRGGGTVFSKLSFLGNRTSVPVMVDHQHQIGTADQLWQWTFSTLARSSPGNGGSLVARSRIARVARKADKGELRPLAREQLRRRRLDLRVPSLG